MSNSDEIKLTNAKEEAFRSFEKNCLDRQEHDLNAEINRAVALAEPAFKQTWSNVSTLVDVDRVIGLLKFLGSHAQRLNNSGRPDAHNRVSAILADLTAARVTLAQTIGMPDTAYSKDRKKFLEEEGKWRKQQQDLINNRLTQGNIQANEIRKLL